MNPGPSPGPRNRIPDGDSGTGSSSGEATVMVTSYNVRGLNDEKKLRHLLNKIYKEDKGKNFDSIVCLQETYITNPSIPYLWRGNLHLTPGTGSSCGCLTLVSPHLNICHSTNIDGRAHVLVCQKAGSNVTYIIANVYALNANNMEKLDFFDKLYETVAEMGDRFANANVIMAGDYNTIFGPTEALNRQYTAQERRVADFVKERIRALGIVDGWEDNGKASFTWRRPNTDIFSTIDRIQFSSENLELVNIKVNWSFSFSDHAAVNASFKIKAKGNSQRSKITRLDPSLAKSKIYGPLIEQGFNSLMDTVPPDWNPHLRLEFAKMSIRTVVEKIQAERKQAEISEEENLNEELDTAIEQLSKGHLGNNRDLIDYVEELRARKQAFIEERGARLAERLGTKWFNEGEKSSRYFLRLLNRTLPDNFEILQGEDGEIISDPEEIEGKIVAFYKKLYEEDNDVITENDDDFFNLIEPISEDEDDDVAKPLTTDDLRTTLKSCTDSAPGPDGIPYSYMELLWTTFGKILCEAWHYSLQRSCLPPSHKNSFLKLIPKAGKDLSKLTNWRPITLSNCDHKLITKTYARKLSEKVASKICGNQAAYLKTRLINDNIRAILATIALTNIEEISGLIVSLDAKKAFDSVDHRYIEKCLIKFGCSKFVPIFKTLYKDLKTDIIINGKIVPGFHVKRGVKQGDALSCILFIMCMEPLLRNLNSNRDIVAVRSNLLECDLPKVYAYADDVNCITIDNETSLKELFREYERLTRASGLELNADKTEIMRLGNNEAKTFSVLYKEADHVIHSLNEIKVNGILFQRDQETLLQRNVDEVVLKMDRQFKAWNRRNLCTLGKILIAKTFGISQAIYLMQSVNLNEAHFKKLNAVLYKFIWNRRYLAAKAPERVKREIVNKSIKLGGYGMIDIKELDDSLKIRAFGRLLNTQHPFLRILKNKLNLSSYFEPKLRGQGIVDSVLVRGFKLIREDRNKMWELDTLNSDRRVLAAIRDMEIRDVVDRRGHNSIIYFNLWIRGARKIGDLNSAEVGLLSRHINPIKIRKLEIATNINPGATAPFFSETYYVNKKHKPLSCVTSKEIRLNRASKVPGGQLKIGVTLSEAEIRCWGSKLAGLTSTRHKNTLLRVVHGEVYTQSKLHRFGMSDTDKCPRCNDSEDLKHKFVDCQYVERIWLSAKPYLDKLQLSPENNPDRIKTAIAALSNSSLASMTYTAELLQTILYFKPEQEYLVHPKQIALRTLKNLAIKEGNFKIKGLFIELLNEIGN